MQRKLFTIIREDLPVVQQAVQGGHAVAEYLLHNPQTEWDNGTLIYLGVKNEEELLYWGEKMKLRDIDWIGFREPDIGNQMTAIATVGDGKYLAGLPLLGKRRKKCIE